MNLSITLFSEPWIQRLGWVLLHFIWQGTAIALLLVLALHFLARASSHIRYLMIGGALLICGVMPVVTWTFLGSQPEPYLQSALASTPIEAPRVEVPAISDSNSYSNSTLGSSVNNGWQESAYRGANAALPYAVCLWFGGVLILTLRLTLGWTLMQRLRLSGLPIHDALCLERFRSLMARMQISIPVRVLKSALVEVPTLIGWLRPTILVPASVLVGLTPDQLEAILAHELAHVRRYDYLINLFQTVIETILFYHPAVWWISRKLREERENCCDDIALEVMADRLVYVSALAQLEEGRAMHLALSASGGSLLQRIRRIVGVNDRKASAWPLWVLIIGILSIASLTKGKADEAAISPKLSVADDSTDKLNNLRIGNLNVEDVPLNQFIIKITKEFAAQDPQKLGFNFILNIPPGEAPLRLSLGFARDPNFRSNVHGILAFVKSKYPIQYHIEGLAIYVKQLSQKEIAFHRKAKETIISLDFDQTEASTALAAIQTAAAAKGFVFDLKGLDTIKALNALKPESANLITLEADPLSVDQALRSVLYLGKISATPLEPYTGYTLSPNSDEAVQKETFLEVLTFISNIRNVVTESTAKQKTVQEKMKGVGVPSLLLMAYPGQEGSVSVKVDGPEPKEKYTLSLDFKPEVIDKTLIQFTGTINLMDAHEKKIDALTGQWKQSSGASTHLSQEWPTLAFPRADTDKTAVGTNDNVLPAGTDINLGYDLAVTATLIDGDGQPLLPSPHPEESGERNTPFIRTTGASTQALPISPPPDPFRFHTPNTSLQNSIDWNEDMTNYKGEITPEGMAEALGTGQNKTVQIFWNRGFRDCSELCHALSQGAPLSEVEARLKIDTANPTQDRLITPLAVAVEHGNLEAVHLLLENGADPNKGETAYLRPLARAAAIIRPDIVEVLLQKGAHPESTVLYGTIASAGNSACQPYLPSLEKIAELLIHAGGVKGTSEFESYILLTDASYTAKNPVMLKMLLDAGLKPSSKGDNGKTALEYVKDAYDKRETERWNHGLKRVLDMLEAADKGSGT